MAGVEGDGERDADSVDVDDDPESPFGPPSHPPLDDASEAPEGYPIKGNAGSMKYHQAGGRWYEQTVAEVWFATTDAAEAAGFIEAGTKADDSDSTSESDADPADAGDDEVPS